MVADAEDLSTTRECCEAEELLSASGVLLSPDVYKQLLVIYLIDNDIVHAKFLWKRIPPTIKTANHELQAVWKIAQYLWKRDFANVYATAKAEEWSCVLKALIPRLCDKLRERMLRLVVQAYSVIHITELGKLLGLADVEVIELATTKSWTIDLDNKVVKPKKEIVETCKENVDQTTETFDHLMNSLTDYVTFLEN